MGSGTFTERFLVSLDFLACSDNSGRNEGARFRVAPLCVQPGCRCPHALFLDIDGLLHPTHHISMNAGSAVSPNSLSMHAGRQSPCDVSKLCTQLSGANSLMSFTHSNLGEMF